MCLKLSTKLIAKLMSLESAAQVWKDNRQTVYFIYKLVRWKWVILIVDNCINLLLLIIVIKNVLRIILVTIWRSITYLNKISVIFHIKQLFKRKYLFCHNFLYIRDDMSEGFCWWTFVIYTSIAKFAIDLGMRVYDHWIVGLIFLI